MILCVEYCNNLTKREKIKIKIIFFLYYTFLTKYINGTFIIRIVSNEIYMHFSLNISKLATVKEDPNKIFQETSSMHF